MFRCGVFEVRKIVIGQKEPMFGPESSLRVDAGQETIFNVEEVARRSEMMTSSFNA